MHNSSFNIIHESLRPFNGKAVYLSLFQAYETNATGGVNSVAGSQGALSAVVHKNDNIFVRQTVGCKNDWNCHQDYINTLLCTAQLYGDIFSRDKLLS